MLGLVVAIVLWSSVQAHAFLFTVGSPTQCDTLVLSWSGGTPPFQLLVTQVFGVPRNLSIPQEAFKNGQGSFSFQVAYAAGQKLLLTMSDATGFGSGGSTGLLVVGSSRGGTCDVTSPVLGFNFQLNSALQQCRPYTISGYSNAVQPVTFIGIVPGGTSVVLNLPLASGSFDWNADVAQGISMIFLMVDAVGRSGGSSDIKTVGASDDSSCLNNLSPSSTPAASATISPSASSGTSGSSTSSSTSKPHKGISIAAVAGGVAGGLIFLACIITLSLFCLRKRRDTWGASSSVFRQPRNARSKVDLTYDPGLSPNMHPYASGSATPIGSSTPFSDSNAYLDESLQRQDQARYLLPSQHSQSTVLSQYQLHPFPNPGTDPFDPYANSVTAQSTIVQPFVHPPPRESMSTVQRKAGTSAYTPSSRFIVHTDVEDDLTPSEVIELPPRYSDRRSPSPYHGLTPPTLSSQRDQQHHI